MFGVHSFSEGTCCRDHVKLMHWMESTVNYFCAGEGKSRCDRMLGSLNLSLDAAAKNDEFVELEDLARLWQELLKNIFFVGGEAENKQKQRGRKNVTKKDWAQRQMVLDPCCIWIIDCWLPPHKSTIPHTIFTRSTVGGVQHSLSWTAYLSDRRRRSNSGHALAGLVHRTRPLDAG